MESQQLAGWLGSSLVEMRRSGSLVDVSLESESGDRLGAHRLVLASSSPYLRALFLHSPTDNLIHTHAPTHTLHSILTFAYTATLNIQPSHVEYLVRIADLWAMDDLLSHVAEYVLERLSMANAVGVWRFGQLYPRLGITSHVRKFILYHLEEMILMGTSTEVQALTADLLNDDWLRLSQECEMAEMVRKWSEGEAGRSTEVPRLLGSMRVSQSPTGRSGVGDGVGPDPSSVEALSVRVNAKSGVARVPQDVVLAIGGWSQGAPTSALEAYDLNSDRWECVGNDGAGDGATPRAYHGIAEVDGEVYLVGGFDGTDYYNSVRAWNPVSGAWRNAACMYVARCYVSVAVLEGEIYAFGGFDGRNRLASAEKFDPVKNQWSLLPSMSTARSDACAVTYKGRIYVIGGFDGHSVLSSVECWEVGRGWEEVGGMGTPRSGVSAVVAGGDIWVFGGFDGDQRLNSGEHYDGKGWERAPPMLGARSNFALIAIPGPDDALLAIGGYNGHQTVATLERFSLSSRWWKPLRSMQLNRSALKAILLHGLPEERLLSLLQPTAPSTSSAI